MTNEKIIEIAGSAAMIGFMAVRGTNPIGLAITAGCIAASYIEKEDIEAVYNWASDIFSSDEKADDTVDTNTEDFTYSKGTTL